MRQRNPTLKGGRILKNWILVVGYSRPHFEAAQKEWIKYNVHLQLVETIPEAIEKLSTQLYLAVIASYDVSDITSLIEVMREARQIPLLVLSQEESGTKMAESIMRGADTFIIDPDKLIDSIKKNKDILERLSELSTYNKQALGILTHRDIFMLVEYRMVFVQGKEITLTKSEFEILQLLLSQAGRVFTYEQIYLFAYGDDVSAGVTINAIRCHIKRIRQRLRIDPDPVDYIDSVRSIGYRIAV